MTEKRYEKIWEHGKIIGTKDTKNHVSMNVKTMIRELNSQDERINELEIGENEIILKQETTINQLIKEKEELKEGLQEFREYCNYLKSILEDNEIWYE